MIPDAHGGLDSRPQHARSQGVCLGAAAGALTLPPRVPGSVKQGQLKDRLPLVLGRTRSESPRDRTDTKRRLSQQLCGFSGSGDQHVSTCSAPGGRSVGKDLATRPRHSAPLATRRRHKRQAAWDGQLSPEAEPAPRCAPGLWRSEHLGLSSLWPRRPRLHHHPALPAPISRGKRRRGDLSGTSDNEDLCFTG